MRFLRPMAEMTTAEFNAVLRTIKNRQIAGVYCRTQVRKAELPPSSACS
jgi:hypothetical protein